MAEPAAGCGVSLYIPGCAIHCKVKENHQYVMAYVARGINTDSRKDILGIWIGQHESAKFWAGVPNDLKSRGINDVYLFCADGLNGFREIIWTAYPQAQIQRCSIHQIRSSTRYVSWKDIKTLIADLKNVYQSLTEEEGLSNLIAFQEAWGINTPPASKAGRRIGISCLAIARPGNGAVG